MHLTIIIIIATTALIFVAVLYLGYSPSILRAEHRKLLLILPIVVVYFGVAFWVIVEGFHRPLKEAPDISVSILWTVVFLYYVINWIQSSRRSGKVLLDIRSIPNRFAYIALAIIFMLLGFISDFFYFVGTPYARYASIALGASFAIAFLVMARSRLQVREKGIWAYGRLQPWEKIESFDFHRDENIHILTLVYKNRMPVLLRTSALAIPSKTKGRLVSLLESHLPNKSLIGKSA
jgi:hypothetical protein